MRSFAGNKTAQQRIRPGIDAGTEEIAGCHTGSRDRDGAGHLRKSLPPVCRQCAVCHTDFRSSYKEVFPSERHPAVPEQSGKTNYIERFNNTMRQRISRLVRKTLSFSKKVENHIGAIWNFIHYYNESLKNFSPLPL